MNCNKSVPDSSDTLLLFDVYLKLAVMWVHGAMLEAAQNMTGSTGVNGTPGRLKGLWMSGLSPEASLGSSPMVL